MRQNASVGGADGNYPIRVAQDACKLDRDAWSIAFLQFFFKSCNGLPAGFLSVEGHFRQGVISFSLTLHGGLMEEAHRLYLEICVFLGLPCDQHHVVGVQRAPYDIVALLFHFKGSIVNNVAHQIVGRMEF